MKASLIDDRQRLKELGCEDCYDIAQKFRRLSASAMRHPDFHVLAKLYTWLFTPGNLWPIDIDELLRHVIQRIKSKRRLWKAIIRLCSFLGEVPPKASLAPLIRNMRLTERGQYEKFVRARFKYKNYEKLLYSDSGFRAEWKEIKVLFNVQHFQNESGIIHRQVIGERNINFEAKVKWDRQRDLFFALFDTFCCRWNLYGMRGDRPLLLKMSVDLTAYGTMVFIPSYWSLDPKRDFNWKAITQLHCVRVAGRQGPKLSQDLEEARRLQRLEKKAISKGLTGGAMNKWLMKEMRWDPRTDEKKLKRRFDLLKAATRHSHAQSHRKNH